MAKIKVASEEYVNSQINDALGSIGVTNPYIIEITDVDWSGDASPYAISIPQSTHNISTPRDVSIFKLTEDGYVMSHGIYDNFDYTILIDNSNGVTITSTTKFSGRIIIRA